MVQGRPEIPVVLVQAVREVLEKLRLPETPVTNKKLTDRPVGQAIREGVQVIRVIPAARALRHPQFV